MIETILEHWLCLSIGAFFGFILAGILSAGRREDLQSITDITYKK